ncbi:hypothetical protein Tco_0025897 [Tanacetum coccineum]
MSSINAFPMGDLYSPQFSKSFQENTGYWQEPNTQESLVEQVATSPTTNKKKATRNRQKRTSQSIDSPRQTLWTTKEEITLCKGWLAVSENSKDGNAKKQSGFWVEVLEYIESKTKQYGRRTYDMESGAGNEDYVQRAMIDYEIETGIPFKLRHCWDMLKDRPKYKLVPSCFAIFTFEPLTLSLTSMPSCDLECLTNILILCLILKASNQSLRKIVWQISQGYALGLLLTACELDDVQQVFVNGMCPDDDLIDLLALDSISAFWF